MGFPEEVCEVEISLWHVCEDHLGREDEEERGEGTWRGQGTWPSGAGRTISVTAGPGREYPARPSARSLSYFRLCLDLTEGG